ncbi:MAG: 3-deoxy-manno-octulosonate cytidylyltransferase [Acidithiobacillales bacterium]
MTIRRPAMLVSNVPRVAAVIPSRFGAERFPGKPLHPISGVPMVLRVLERVQRAAGVDLVLVATDDARIVAAVEAVGGRAAMTDPALPSGTDRVWAAVRDLPVEIVLNVQGDEPLMDPLNIERVATFLRRHPECPLATVALPLPAGADASDPAVVKVVRGDDGRALYFSRAAIPYRRRPEPGLPTLKHLGLYGYRKEALKRWTELPPHPLERTEGLEQLRALAAGMRMAVLDAASDSIGVDTIEDARRVEEILEREKQKTSPASRMADVKGLRPQGGAQSAPLTSAIRETDFHLSAAAPAAAAYQRDSFAAAAAAAGYQQEDFGALSRVGRR